MNPAKYGGRKFDMRVWAMITSTDPLRIVLDRDPTPTPTLARALTPTLTLTPNPSSDARPQVHAQDLDQALQHEHREHGRQLHALQDAHGCGVGAGLGVGRGGR